MKKIGILGGGQLGRMLLQEAANYPVETFVMESDSSAPAAHLCHHFTLGDIRNFEEVLAFGRKVEVLTIEIEAVNLDALEVLEKEGVLVIPKVSALRIIKNKITQKEFYKQHEIPTSPFHVTQSKNELAQFASFLPAVHKIGEGGYDGKGVELLHNTADFEKGFEAPSVLEKMVNLEKEIAVMVGVSSKGETVLYPPVEMVFDPRLNLLDFQICPAQLEEKTFWKAEAIALKLVKALQSPGLFAVEMFVDKTGEVLVNETAPRVHNSGHHTIEAHASSQYDMVWRILLELPLGNTDALMPSALVNLIGEPGHNGPVVYEGLEEVLKMDYVYVHLYGKSHTKPGRKMGHVTILGKDRIDLVHKATKIKQTLKVKAL
jgi:5-(carboxyamino)imidazole ribonucleotide synthase